MSKLAFPAHAVERYGAPSTAFVTYTPGVSSADPEALSIDVVLLGKSPTMIGESTMISFHPMPKLKSAGAWAMEKLGSKVDPEDVIAGGNQMNHGVWEGVTASMADGRKLEDNDP